MLFKLNNIKSIETLFNKTLVLNHNITTNTCCIKTFRQESNGDYTYSPHIKVPLTHGSLLIMEGASQDDWQVHCSKIIHLCLRSLNCTEEIKPTLAIYIVS